MDIVRDCLTLTPNTWDKSANFSNERFSLVTLSSDSEEYITVSSKFCSSHPRKVKSIRRVQHLYAYIRYCLHKLHLEKNCERFTETVEYDGVDVSRLRIYLDYNCDPRRRGNIYGGRDVVYVQKARIISDSFLGERDSGRYPTYVISVEGTQQQDVNSLLLPFSALRHDS